MEKIIKHGSVGLSFHTHNCTVYIDFFDKGSRKGIWVDYEGVGKEPVDKISYANIFLFRGTLNLLSTDKLIFEKKDKIPKNVFEELERMYSYAGEVTPVIQHVDGTRTMLYNIAWKKLDYFEFECAEDPSPMQRRLNKLVLDNLNAGYDKETATLMMYEQDALNYIYTHVLYYNEELTATTFYKEPCLWITKIEQRTLPHMESVGGYPNEYCVFIKNLTSEDISHLTYWNEEPVEIEVLLGNFLERNK